MNSAKVTTSPLIGKAIGVLDMQGGVCEHIDHLQRIGISARPVKHSQDFEGLAGLILPGGESTCLARLLKIFEIEPIIVRKYREGMKLWGTCAGAILLAGSLKGEAAHLGLIDIEVQRNGFGSQLDSFTCEALIPKISPEPVPLTFIRAPKILKAGEGVDILLCIDDFIAAAESPDVLVTVFHPELTGSLAFHRYFASKCGLQSRADQPILDPSWNMTSWTRYARIV
ncbi:MAG: glutamine amidotransferase subunit PdxT [Syntrophus sp. RIFOXYC2_FULL_54_9]|nr:MAG: glutamine amidotransferase subunit PdxT [Syntrophus sp. GWC2_56_31]OHE31939.1 MAG: glutamine amidotransferase subunit PdxT [Syntrophus sp. RIFOXYC2_FULL_54_9]HBB16422.1 pyridoxal 5'-phosphate synthase glutaminase subunit PdxT [Syntrophus sp. (in: bacteria)]